MATTHNFSVFANSLVRPPVDPKTGLAATLDKRSATQQKNTKLIAEKYDDSALHVDDRAYSRSLSEQLAPSRDYIQPFSEDAGNVSDDFYDMLTKMKDENRKSLEISEKLYMQKRAECDDVSEPTRGLLASVENLSDVHKSVQLDEQQLKKNKEMVQKIIAAGIKSSGIGATVGKPPSGKPKTSDGLPAKSGATVTKLHSRSWADRVRASESFWRAPQSRASSDFDISELERHKDFLMSLSQNVTPRPVDDIWESYSFTDYEPQSHSKAKGKLIRSSSMSRLPTSKSDITGRSDAETWKHRVTVPQPFSMTLREAKRTPRKTKAAIELEQKKVAKQLEEELECQKKFKATPLPAHIFVPMFQELMEEKESKKRMIHETGQQLLKSLQEPFEFMLREGEKDSQKKTMSASVNGKTSSAKFKATPFPSHIFDESIPTVMAEEDEYRRIRAKLRAKELMKSAKLPSSMEERDQDYFVGKSRQRERAKKASKTSLVVEPSFRPKVNKTMPDFDEKYKKFLASLMHKQVKQATVCKPFKLETSKLALKTRRSLAEDTKWKTTLKNGSSQKSQKSSTLSKFITGPLSTSLDSIPAKLTHAAELRASLTRLKQQKLEEKQSAESREKQQKLLKEKQLKQVVAARSVAMDVALHALDREELLKTKIEAEKERSASYRRKLNEMKKRLQERPLLFEQIAEKNARMAAERKYYATLSKSGLNIEYLSKKSTSDVVGSISAHEAEDIGLHDSQIHDDQSPGSPVKEDSPPVSSRRSGPGSRPSSGRISERSFAKSVEEEVKEDDEEEEEYADDFGGSEKRSDDDDDDDDVDGDDRKDETLVEEA